MSSATAKVFMSGRSQAVRLPKPFRVNTAEVYISRRHGGIFLSPKPCAFTSRQSVSDWLASVHCPDIEIERPSNGATQRREMF